MSGDKISPVKAAGLKDVEIELAAWGSVELLGDSHNEFGGRPIHRTNPRH